MEGEPEIVIFYNGSVQAFGDVVYVQWRLGSGGWWSTLVICKKYLYKEDAKVKPYKGVQVAGIQAAADWTSKLWQARELRGGGFWQTGLKFVRKDVEEWPSILSFQIDVLEGKLIPKPNHTSVRQLIAKPYTWQLDMEEKLCSVNSHSVSEENGLNNLLNRHNDVEKNIKF